jgi:uncharacterized membrane protein HdeD (DUF308 family)
VTPPTPDPAKLAQERAKLRRTVLILAPILILGGILVLAFLQRMPTPLRLLVGIGDIIVGLTLLVLLKQKFFDK